MPLLAAHRVNFAVVQHRGKARVFVFKLAAARYDHPLMILRATWIIQHQILIQGACAVVFLRIDKNEPVGEFLPEFVGFDI